MFVNVILKLFFKQLRELFFFFQETRYNNNNNFRSSSHSVIELTGDVMPDIRAIGNADVIVTTPEKWDGVSRSWQTRKYVKAVSLLVIDEIHLLGMCAITIKLSNSSCSFVY